MNSIEDTAAKGSGRIPVEWWRASRMPERRAGNRPAYGGKLLEEGFVLLRTGYAECDCTIRTHHEDKLYSWE
jgi:hypothetical protein